LITLPFPLAFQAHGSAGLGSMVFQNPVLKLWISRAAGKTEGTKIAWNSGQHYRVILRRGIFYLSQPPRFGLVLAGAICSNMKFA
jgi:hypothetical protein